MDKKTFISTVISTLAVSGINATYDKASDRITTEAKTFGDKSIAPSLCLTGITINEVSVRATADALIRAYNGADALLKASEWDDAPVENWQENVLLRVADPTVNPRYAGRTPIKSLVGGLMAYAYIPLDDSHFVEILPQNAESGGFHAPVSSYNLFEIASKNTERLAGVASAFGEIYATCDSKASYGSGCICSKHFLESILMHIRENCHSVDGFCLLPVDEAIGYIILPLEMGEEADTDFIEGINAVNEKTARIGREVLFYKDGALSDKAGNRFAFE